MSDFSKETAAFQKLIDILTILRGPNGCKWDKEQTPASLKGNLLEECYELLDAIDNHDDANVKEEAGDVYLVATMIAYIYQEERRFTIAEILEELNAKLIRRHPHVFGNERAANAEESLALWRKAKEQEGKSEEGSLSRTGRGLPPLEKAFKLQKKSAKNGFFGDSPADVLKKAEEEFEELRVEAAAQNRQGIQEELGDLFFSLACVAGSLQVDPAAALHAANQKFTARYHFVEKQLKKLGLEMSADNKEAMETAWQEAKKAGI